MSPETHKETAPLGFDREGWPLPEVRSMMVENFVRSWRRHWIAVIILFVLSVFLVLFSTWLVSPRWEGQAKIQIYPQALPDVVIADEMRTSGGIVEPDTLGGNMVEIMNSLTFLRKVVDELDLDQYFQQQAQRTDPRTRIKKLIASTITAPIRLIRPAGEPDWKYKALDELSSTWVTAASLEKTTTIPLLIYGDNPDKTVEVGDTILRLLQEEMDKIFRTRVETVAEDLRGKVADYEDRIASNQQTITEARISSPSAAPEQYSSALFDLQEEEATLQLELDRIQAQIDSAYDQLKDIPEFVEVTADTAGSASAFRSSEQLQINLANARSELSQLEQRYGPQSPRVAAQRAVIDALQKELDDIRLTEESRTTDSQRVTKTLSPKHNEAYQRWSGLQVQKAGIEARERGLEAAILTLTEAQKAAILNQAELEKLQRLAKKDEEDYNRYYSKLRDVENMLTSTPVFKSLVIAEHTTVLNRKKPDYPNMLLAGILALAIGLFTALVLPVGYDYLNQTLLSSRQAQAIPGVRVVAVVPKMNGRRMYQSAS
ncbi:MAG: GumC family protein [Phycisphaerales bacterium]